MDGDHKNMTVHQGPVPITLHFPILNSLIYLPAHTNLSFKQPLT